MVITADSSTPVKVVVGILAVKGAAEVVAKAEADTEAKAKAKEVVTCRRESSSSRARML